MSLEIKAVSTTVSCQVSGGEGHLSAEIDSRPYGLNGGKTQWFEGDTCYVLVYKSDNVKIIGTKVTQGLFGAASPPQGFITGASGVGYNIVREGLAFTTPVASSSKPMPADTKVLHAIYPDNLCGGFQFLQNTTVARLTQWYPSGQIDKVPPYGFVFVEYSPKAEIYAFTNLPKPAAGLFSFPVHAFIYGIATPALNNFSTGL